jgi:hypothetical protein
MYNLKVKLLKFIFLKIIKYAENEEYPKWVLWLFFPLQMYCQKKAAIYIDYSKNTVRLFGVELPMHLLEAIRESNDNDVYDAETYYHFKKDKNNVVSIDKKYIEVNNA